MSKYKHIFVLSAVLLVALFGVVNAAPLSYTSPSNISVKMYRLNLDGSPWVDQNTGNRALCSYSSTVFGCTAFTGSWTYRYPYGHINPVSVPIETDYLLDVVSQEMGTITFNEEARHAQAVAARSFAYHHSHFDPYTGAPTMNNSTEFQVFIPYRWEKCRAIAFSEIDQLRSVQT
ncbi:MAG: SpoIID/LytB domain-containing protein [Anaerolineae bacterium]|nr:SpoIID/LytB domain-containing protein [Anaerolineae bacterium]MCO5193431.1 SpoIID/LytB domain-containing protein [Anaerolineae bacterium]MCO5198952.1 SpoIID/LytB domain-containing protein [Anaerolineae bacterium]MCO5204913.1 SpoIID/LytB domain-containing protein [Anaerolineae bacterium]